MSQSADEEVPYSLVERVLLDLKPHQQISWAFDQRVGDPAVKFTLVALTNRANSTGVCWPRQELIAEDIEASVKSVQRYIDNLKDQGLIFSFARYRSQNPDGTGKKVRASNYYVLRLHLPPDLVERLDVERNRKALRAKNKPSGQSDAQVGGPTGQTGVQVPSGQSDAHKYDGQNGPTYRSPVTEQNLSMEPSIENKPTATSADAPVVAPASTDAKLSTTTPSPPVADPTSTPEAEPAHPTAVTGSEVEAVGGDREAWAESLGWDPVLDCDPDTWLAAYLGSAPPPEPAKPARPRNPLFDVLCALEDRDISKMSRSERSKIAGLVNELKEVGATPEEVERRWAHYEAAWPWCDGAKPTAAGLVTGWSTYDAAPKPKATSMAAQRRASGSGRVNKWSEDMKAAGFPIGNLSCRRALTKLENEGHPVRRMSPEDLAPLLAANGFYPNQSVDQTAKGVTCVEEP